MTELAAYLRTGRQQNPLNETDLTENLRRVSTVLDALEKCVIPDEVPRIEAMQRAITAFDVRVSLVGQVKAGKTALVNALIGKPEMLPSDVNPWTSVVTSVHINTQKPGDHRAVFTFFSQEEWDDMVGIGGRLGEVAERTDFEAELDTVREQITALQTATENRLGRNFKFLLGKSHNFSGFNPDLIKRYVCLGDEEDAALDGRYADLTRSADLYLDDPLYGFPVVLRDTPGVNDPFLVREAVTLENLGDSDICVVVLSAHQALTTVDIALLRILMALENDQIIIFINRVDELEDPDRQIAEIDKNIRQTLAERGLSKDLPVIFGSALWANLAAAGLADDDMGESAEVLRRLIADRSAKASGPSKTPAGQAETNLTKTHDLSGLGELQHVIDLLAREAVGKPFLLNLHDQIADICQQSALVLRQHLDGNTKLRKNLDLDGLVDRIDAELAELDAECSDVMEACSETMIYEMSAAYRDFIASETRYLNQLMDAEGSTANWDPDTHGLRRRLNAAYRGFSDGGQSALQKVFDRAADVVANLYRETLDDGSQIFGVKAPRANRARVPTALMKTMTIDITTGWMEKWLMRSKAKQSIARRLEVIVTDEMVTMTRDMQEIYIPDMIKAARAKLFDFMNSHIQTIESLSALDGSAQRDLMREKLGVDAEINKRLMELAAIEAKLDSLKPEATDKTKAA